MGALVGWENYLEALGATVAASSEASGLGARSLATPAISEVWRSGPWGASTVDVDVDLGAVRPINVVGIAAPRDGLLPSDGATVGLQMSAAAALNRANLQPNPTTIVPGGGTYSIGAGATDLGAVTRPGGGAGARRIGSSSGTGVAVSLAGAAILSAAGGARYRLSGWFRSNATAPTRGTILTVDESASGAVLRRQVGPGLANTVDGTWRPFSRDFTTLSGADGIQVQWAEGWQSGAEIEVADLSIVRLGDALELAPAPMLLSPYGFWGWCDPVARSARYMRLSFTGTAADAYLQLGRLWAGPALITARAAGYGHRRGAVDPGSNARAPASGLRVPTAGAVYRAPRWTVGVLSAAEATQLERAALAAGTTRQVISARNHLDLRGSGMFGAFASLPEPERIASGIWRAEFSLEEDL